LSLRRREGNGHRADDIKHADDLFEKGEREKPWEKVTLLGRIEHDHVVGKKKKQHPRDENRSSDRGLTATGATSQEEGSRGEELSSICQKPPHPTSHRRTDLEVRYVKEGTLKSYRSDLVVKGPLGSLGAGQGDKKSNENEKFVWK